jgi:uncharacterized lipoprotein YbaY
MITRYTSSGAVATWLALSALGCGGGTDAPIEEPTVENLQGTVVLAEDGPVPGSSLRISLLDVTVPGEPGIPLSSLVLTVDTLPVAFTLPYGVSSIRHLHVYALEARLESPGGEPLHRTSTPIRLFEESTSDPLTVTLHPEALALWWDPQELTRMAAELDARRDGMQRVEGAGRRGAASTTWVAWMEDGVTTVIEETVDHGGQGNAVVRYHLRNGRVFRYAEEGARWVMDLSGTGREAPLTLQLSFDPDGEVLGGIRTQDNARTDLPPGEVEEVRAHIPRLLEAVGGGS